jgi:hypothetical protein
VDLFHPLRSHPPSQQAPVLGSGMAHPPPTTMHFPLLEFPHFWSVSYARAGGTGAERRSPQCCLIWATSCFRVTRTCSPTFYQRSRSCYRESQKQTCVDDWSNFSLPPLHEYSEAGYRPLPTFSASTTSKPSFSLTQALRTRLLSYFVPTMTSCALPFVRPSLFSPAFVSEFRYACARACSQDGRQ